MEGFALQGEPQGSSPRSTKMGLKLQWCLKTFGPEFITKSVAFTLKLSQWGGFCLGVLDGTFPTLLICALSHDDYFEDWPSIFP